MTKAPSPLLGYNNNVRHKGRVFHIQTEDSGVNRPHIITHLFMDGGRILKSVKTSYAEHVGNEKLGEVVKKMMKDQHKAMFTALRDGSYDQLLDDAVKSASQHRMAAASAKAARGKSAPPPPVEAPTTQRDPEVVEVTEPMVPPGAPDAELNLDLDALERASQATAGFVPASQPDLPPPPANLLRERLPAEPDTGRYRSLVPTGEERVPSSRAVPRPAPRSERTPAPRPAARSKSERPPRVDKAVPRSERPARRSERPPPSVREDATAAKNDPRAEPPSDSKQPIAARADGKFAPARPAAIFGQARPQQGSSIFGEDLISDKSLDEVILSYLAEDLEDGTK